MRYALSIIRFEYRRYLAAILIVAAITALMGLQFGILTGLLGLVSLPVDVATADLWLTSPNVPSCDLGVPMPVERVHLAWRDPQIAAADELIFCYCYWRVPKRGNVLVSLIGINTDDTSLGPINLISRKQRLAITELGTVVVDESERRRLNVWDVGQTGEIMGKQIRVGGFTNQMQGITGPYVVCSLQTARLVMANAGYDARTTTYLLARCRQSGNAGAVAQRLATRTDVSCYTANAFSFRSRWYWLTMTKAGLAVGLISVLALAVSTVITSQTLYAATLALAKELALLRALGAARWRLARFVMDQACVVGLLGILGGLLAMELLAYTAERLGAHPSIDWRVRIGSALITFVMIIASGIIAMVSLNRTDPVQLLR